MIIILPVNAHSHFQGPSNVIFDDGNHDDEKREKRIDVHCWWSCCCEEHEHRQDFPHFQLFPFDLKFTKSQIKVSTCKLLRFITKRILALS